MIEKQNSIVSKDKLLEAGVYFGHRKSMRHPKMIPYISRIQRGTHIIDIEKTKRVLQFAYDLIKSYAEKGASFIFVGTRNQAKETIKKNALRTNSFYVSERWLGGTFTNSRTIFQRVRRMEHLEKLDENHYEGYTKKEGLLFKRELQKLQRNLQGIRAMRRRPNIMIIADPAHDAIAIKEAKKLGVRTIGIVDTNNDPSMLDVAIPANDDSIKSITLIITILADAIAFKKGGVQLFAFQEDAKIELPSDPRRSKDTIKKRFSNWKKPTRPYYQTNKFYKPKVNTPANPEVHQDQKPKVQEVRNQEKPKDQNPKVKAPASPEVHQDQKPKVQETRNHEKPKAQNPKVTIDHKGSQDQKQKTHEAKGQGNIQIKAPREIVLDKVKTQDGALASLKVVDLRKLAKEKSIQNYLKMKKAELIDALAK